MRFFSTLITLLATLALNAQLPDHASRISLGSCYAPFYHGVASGDPLPNAVIIWTRITPEAGVGEVAVNWRMATNAAMTDIVQSGVFTTHTGRDFTVKVDVTGLSPNTFYYYDFSYDGQYSVAGRTRTAPTGNPPRARFAVVSCANFEDGWFNAYRHMRDRNDYDAVIHLGDYIYEYESGEFSSDLPGRTHDPLNELVDLSDYRMRYSHYRLDADVRDLHQQYPFICVWDDHEFANDAYLDGAENHQPASEGPWETRVDNAKKAYFEWMPIREQIEDPQRIYRTFTWGNLIDLMMLDTRMEAREIQPSLVFGDLDAPGRDLLGDVQFAWLKDALKNSNAIWKLIGNQVMMAPIEVLGSPVYTDMWDGYQFERRSLFDSIAANNIQNVVVLTGDFHTSWANDLPTDDYDLSEEEGSIGVEFACPSITSTNFDLDIFEWWAEWLNDHVRYTDFSRHGYVMLDVTRRRSIGEFWYVNTVESPTFSCLRLSAWQVKKNAPFLRLFTAPVTAATLSAPLADACPAGIAEKQAASLVQSPAPVLLGVYPNPAANYLTVQCYLPQAGEVFIYLTDLQGKQQVLSNELVQEGLWNSRMALPAGCQGQYVFTISLNGQAIHTRVVVVPQP